MTGWLLGLALVLLGKYSFFPCLYIEKYEKNYTRVGNKKIIKKFASKTIDLKSNMYKKKSQKAKCAKENKDDPKNEDNL